MNITLESYPFEGYNILLPNKSCQMETESQRKIQLENYKSQVSALEYLKCWNWEPFQKHWKSFQNHGSEQAHIHFQMLQIFNEDQFCVW